MLPRGTHDYSRFITPAELGEYCRSTGLSLHRVTGMTYNPFNKTYALGADSSVNYILSAQSA
jgi:2-polyprenyl-6-hydroxyphenyl methylase/3-demethylubiquinone-9 3-methyltransferase